MPWLELTGPSGQTSRFQVAERPLFIGRDPSNDVVLVDDTVSNRHAFVWVRDGQVWIEDLKSTNGTHVNGKKVTEPKALSPGDAIVVGRKNTRFFLRSDDGETSLRPTGPMVEDLGLGVRHGIGANRFTIGPDEGCDVVVSAGADETATLMIHANGEIWLGRGDAAQELADGAEFSVGAHKFRLHRPEAARQATRLLKNTGTQYAVTATLNGAVGPEATVTDTAQARTHKVTAENRATLLYVLAKKAMDDTEAGLPDEVAGWCTDDEVVVGVWGRSALDNPTNSLHVLISRLRKELREDKFDPWFIEKRRGHLRIRASEARIV